MMLNRKILLLLPVLLFHLRSYSQNSPLDEGLISYYNFNEDASDLVGPNNGTVKGAEVHEGRCGDRCFYFDGGEDYIDCGNDISLNGRFGGMTISVWVRPGQITELELGTILAKWGFNPKIDHFGVWINPSYKIIAAFGNEGVMEEGVFSNTPVPKDEWHHVTVAWSYRRRAIKIYIDGKLDKVGRQEGYGINTKSPLSLKIGRQVVRRSRPFKGYLDELRIYKRALNDNEVKALYDMGKVVCEYALLTGRVLNKKDREPVSEATVIVENLSTSTKYEKIKVDQDGMFELKLPLDDEFAVYADADNFMAENITLDTKDMETGSRINRTLYLIPVEVGERLRLNNIFFDFAKSTLRRESYAELNRIVPLFKRYSGLRVELGGHTDAVGSDEANKKLSEARAEAVRQYLIEQGVPVDHVTAFGYGESEPVATNDTDEGRQLNRRVEFVIVDK